MMMIPPDCNLLYIPIILFYNALPSLENLDVEWFYH